MKQHGALTIIDTIRPGMQQTLSDLLNWIEANDVDTNELIPFRSITGIHFARFVILHERKDVSGNQLPAGLCFTTNYDLPLENHLDELVKVGGKGLWKIFSLCNNFPPKEAYDSTVLLTYLRSNNRKSNTFYVGVGPRSVQQIASEHKLRDAIGHFVDSHHALLDKKEPGFVRSKIIEFVNQSEELAWARTPPPRPSTAAKFTFYGRLVLFVAVVILLLPLLIVILVLWMLIMLMHELTEKKAPNPVSREWVRTLINRENGIVQAQFSAMGNLKPGWFRRTTMSLLLWLTNFLAPYLFSKGSLSGIPTVHFARWLIMNEGRQMLFLSNYDGNSESYLRDFIHIAAKQLTLLFSHSMGYPKTYFMVFKGAENASEFMAWARSHQVITNVWYSANKEVSVKNIYNNSRIREGLYGEMTDKETRKWLSRI